MPFMDFSEKGLYLSVFSTLFISFFTRIGCRPLSESDAASRVYESLWF